MGVKFGIKEGTLGPLLHAKFHPHRCNVSPLRGEKPQNRPLSKLNTGRFALRAMLPVTKCTGANAPTAAMESMSVFNNTTETMSAVKLFMAIICNKYE